MPGSPFEIQELVDRIIDILGCRTWTLLSCSLVARSWVNAAQSHLLQAPERTFSGTGYGLWDKNRLALRFYNTLHTFPHLIRHVRDLRMELIVDSSVTVETFGRICNLPFTHLRSVSIFVRKDLDTKGLQQLFSLPNLVSINLDTWIYHMYSFTTMWRRCSRVSDTWRSLLT
ncbi:hypothetical protein B0H19DRAFT_439627 [Mycena capillaripes]|nr:hypothetical protein B0H19DRAFT_439627 [Mycena capillaripes]